jgi:hypothetical protein
MHFVKHSKKAIVLNGLARGGTNVTWNLLQSHPNVLSTMGELNQIIGKRSQNSFYFNFINRITTHFGLMDFATRAILSALYKAKMNSLDDEFNKFKSNESTYTHDEALKATICMKGVSSPDLWDLKYSELLHATFEETYFISLVRDGYAVCESWCRRGIQPRKAGYYYSKFIEEIQTQSQRYKHYSIIKFEDVISAPFETVSSLYQFVGETPHELDMLRLKVKKVVQTDGSHKSDFGETGKKYWFTKDNIYELLKKDIDKVHKGLLKVDEVKQFEMEARHALEQFNYHM